MIERAVVFLDLLAWAVLAVSALGFVASFYLDMTYMQSHDYTRDMVLRGKPRKSPWPRYLALALLAAAWLWTGRT